MVEDLLIYCNGKSNDERFRDDMKNQLKLVFTSEVLSLDWCKELLMKVVDRVSASEGQIPSAMQLSSGESIWIQKCVITELLIEPSFLIKHYLK